MTNYQETNHQILNYRQILEQFRNSVSRLWKSKKAQTEGFFTSNCNLLPQKIIISREIVPVNNREQLIEDLLDGIKRGCNVGVRTCFSPQPNNSPWIMGIKTVADIENFLTHEYLDWLKMPGITELIVMNNPPDLGNKEKSSEFFVFKMGDRTQKEFSGCYIEMRLDTFQLRSLEADTSPADMIIIKISNFETVTVVIGANYTFDQQEIEYQFSAANYQKIETDLANKLSAKHLRTIYSFLESLRYLMSDSQSALKRKLKAFAEFGLEFSEWQSQIDSAGNNSWMKIYGFKGSNDETHWSTIH